MAFDPAIIEIKTSGPESGQSLSASLDTIGLNNEQVIAVLFFKEHPKGFHHFHIDLDKQQALELMGWLQTHIEKLS